MVVRDYRDLIVWQKSIDLAVEIYALTRQFPHDERFGITSQLRRSAVSVSSNIAEGSGRGTTRDLVNFLTISRGSVREAESMLTLSQRLDFMTPSTAQTAFGLADEVSRMLTALRRSLRTNPPRA